MAVTRNSNGQHKSSSPKIGLACAGGGMEGAIYEIGALCALDEAIEGACFSKLDIYVGVSAGALITSLLANGIAPRTLSRGILSRAEESRINLEPEVLFTPDWQEFGRRIKSLPPIIFNAFSRYLLNPLDISAWGAIAGMGKALPVSLFNNTPMQKYLKRIFDVNGRSDDFRELNTTLRVIAVNLDTSEIARFGDPATAHVPISKAVQASTALPVLYSPVEINGSYYIDGVARRTVHASVALSEGADILFCINPVVPVNNDINEPDAKTLIEKGITPVLSQTFRTLVYSRMKTGFKTYERRFPNQETILIEPNPEDSAMVFSNFFSFSNRQMVCESAYRLTRKFLREHAPEVKKKLNRFGLDLRMDVLDDDSRTLYGNLQMKKAVSKRYMEVEHVLERLEGMLDDVARPEKSKKNGVPVA